MEKPCLHDFLHLVTAYLESKWFAFQVKVTGNKK